MDLEHIKGKIRAIPDFPKKGIVFRDITTLLQDRLGLESVISEFVRRYSGMGIEKVAGIEARGFIIGGALAHRLGVGFVPIRKKGKLPHNVERVVYEKEYGPDEVEMHLDALKPGERVLVADDLLATGGTALAACRLVEKLGGKIVECAFIIDLPNVGGRKVLADSGYKVFNLVEFAGD